MSCHPTSGPWIDMDFYSIQWLISTVTELGATLTRKSKIVLKLFGRIKSLWHTPMSQCLRYQMETIKVIDPMFNSQYRTQLTKEKTVPTTGKLFSMGYPGYRHDVDGMSKTQANSACLWIFYLHFRGPSRYATCSIAVRLGSKIPLLIIDRLPICTTRNRFWMFSLSTLGSRMIESRWSRLAVKLDMQLVWFSFVR